MNRFLLAAAALLAGPALAQGITDQVVAGLQAQGFTRIEVKEGPSQVKVEAIRGDTEVEYVYDLATGALLSQETGRVDAGDDTAPGVEYDTEDRDFVGGGRGDDADGDDDNPGRGRDDDGDDDGDGEDRDRGHGNDADGQDDDNPGRGGGDGADDGDDDGDGGGRGRGRGGDGEDD